LAAPAERQESKLDTVDRAPEPTQEKSQPSLHHYDSDMLSSIPKDVSVTPALTSPTPMEEDLLPTIDSPYDIENFTLQDMPPPSPGADTTDAPPSASPANVNQTDGPFTSTFFRPAQTIQQLIQVRSERIKEGITTKHTTYYPKPLDKSHKSMDHSSYIYSDSYYKMDCFPRGKLTLMNVKYFQRSSGMAEYPRMGTDRDAEGLTNLFLDLGFVVDRFDNPSKKEIEHIVKAAANENFSDKSCCACAILSHGEEGIVYGTDDFVKIKDVTSMFRSRGLAGKPKFFLFQACQGSSRRGSWFMEALVQVFRQNAHKMDVMRMLVRVNDIISSRKSRTDDIKTDNKRQIASLVTQMRKDFFLCPPYGPLPKPSSM